jgi:hypothetical protein
MQQRIYLFDTAKFILFFLVIYGHMLQPNRALSYNCEMYSLIYMFHMPLFIMISGFSLILSLAVMSVISHKNLGVLTEEGRYTMFYYFWHSVLVRILLMLFASLAIEKSVVCLFVGSLIIMGILFLMRRCHIFSYMMHPVSSLRH